jgi:hypothetical protein
MAWGTAELLRFDDILNDERLVQSIKTVAPVATEETKYEPEDKRNDNTDDYFSHAPSGRRRF